jgi:hypothetical protein
VAETEAEREEAERVIQRERVRETEIKREGEAER